MTKKLMIIFVLLLAFSWIIGCDNTNQKSADVNALTKQLPSAPTPEATPTLPPIDTARTDLNRVLVGSTAPDFALEDINSKVVKLADLRGKQNVVLVFYRGLF